MTLVSNNRIQELQRVSAERNIRDFEEMLNIVKRIDNTSKMTDNIDDANRKYDELISLNYNNFDKSINEKVYTNNIKKMEEIIMMEGRTYDQLISMYHSVRECNDIYNKFRGDNNE